jgi:hypothetical protein
MAGLTPCASLWRKDLSFAKPAGVSLNLLEFHYTCCRMDASKSVSKEACLFTPLRVAERGIGGSALIS